MGCLASAKMNMLADIVKPGGSPEVTGTGHWTYTQDATSGAIVRVWIDDDPNTPAVEGNVITISCSVRGILSTGIKGAGTTQIFDQIYQNIEWVKMDFPATFNVSRHDRVIRIRDRNGNVIWKEEESEGQATSFSVMGVTPIVGPFGRHIENQALLKRTDVQLA